MQAQHIAAVYTVGDVGEWALRRLLLRLCVRKERIYGVAVPAPATALRVVAALRKLRDHRACRGTFIAHELPERRVRPCGARVKDARLKRRGGRGRVEIGVDGSCLDLRKLLTQIAQTRRTGDQNDRLAARLPERAYRVQLRLIQDLVASPAGGRAAAAGGDAAAGELFTQLLKDETHIARV